MMNQPRYQKVAKWIGFLLAGALCFGALLDSISNAITLVSLRTAVLITSIVVPVWLLVELTAAVIGIPWGLSQGSKIRIRSLGPSARFGILGVLALLWLPQGGELLPKDETIPSMQVEIHNPTDNEITVTTRGEFVLWLPTAMYDGAPRIGGKLSLTPLNSPNDYRPDFPVPPRGSIRCSAEFLNSKKFLSVFNAAETDVSLMVQTSIGLKISPNAPFTRSVVGQQYLDWNLEETNIASGRSQLKAPNPSFEPTAPGKPGSAAQVKRVCRAWHEASRVEVPIPGIRRAEG